MKKIIFILSLFVIIESNSPPALAQSNTPKQYFEQWAVDSTDEFVEAFTQNESGSRFGVICGRTCVYYLDFKTKCVDGDKYPAMLNAPSGSQSIELKCHVIDGDYLLSTSARISSVLSDKGEVGFAIPLKSGRFNVSRFSLTGANTPVSIALERLKGLRAKNENSLKDFTL